MDLLSEAFKRYRSGENVEDILAWLRENGVRISRTTFYERLRQELDKGTGFVVADGDSNETDTLEVTRKVNLNSYRLIKELIEWRIKEKLREGDYAYVQHLVDLLFSAIHSFCVSSRVLLQIETVSSSEFMKKLREIAEEIGEKFLEEIDFENEEKDSVIERVRDLFTLASNEIARYTEAVTQRLELASSTMIRISAKILKSLNELHRETSAILKEADKLEQVVSVERLLRGR